jgi:hypothetical protein
MHQHKKGTLKSGSGKKVRSRKQAVAIAMSESGQSKKASSRTRNDPMPSESTTPATWFSTCQTGGMA